MMTFSTSTAEAMTEQASYNLDIFDNIVAMDCHGPFNEEIVAQFSEDIKKAITQFEGKAWGSLITYYGNGIFTPEAENALQKITQYRIENGMIAVAAIIKNSVHADIQHMQLHRIYQNTNITFHVFCCPESAKNWLQEFLDEKQ